MSDDNIGDTAFGLQIGIGTIGKFITAVIGFFGSIILARVLGPGDYGLFYVSLSIAQFFENPLNGWAKACKKRMTEVQFNTEQALGSIFIVIAAIAIIGGPAVYFILNLFTSNPLIPIIVPILFISTSAFWSFSTVLSGRANFSLTSWAGVINTSFQVFLKVVLVLIGFGVWGMVFGTTIGALITIPIIYLWIGIRPEIPSLSSLKSIGRFAKWSIPSGFVGTSLSKMDIVLLGWLATSSAAGNYQVALQLSMPAVFISSIIGTGLMGRVSNLDSRKESWIDDLRNSVSYASILAIPIFFGSLVLSKELIITIFSNQYSGAGIFLIGLTLYRFLVTQTNIRGAILQGLDHPNINFRISLIELIINIILGITLWYIYGPIGIVVATVLTQFFGYISRIYAVRTLTNTNILITSPFLKQIVSGFLMAITIWTIKVFIGISSWYGVFILVGIGSIIYFIVLYIVSTHFRITIQGITEDFLNQYIGNKF